MKLPRVRILPLLVAALLSFLTAEGMARLAHRAGWYHPKIVTAEYLQPNPYLREVLKPGSHTRLGNASIDVNSLGFRGEEFEPKKPSGVYRIFVLGGSTTFGYPESIPSTEDTYPYKLEQQLRERLHDPELEVVNGGLTGYTLRTSLVNFATRVLWYEPDMIVIDHAVNDAIVTKDDHDLYYAVIDANLGSNLWETIRNESYVLLELNFRLYKYLWHPAANQVARSDSPPEVTLRAYERNLRNLVDLAQAQGTKVVLANESVVIPETCEQTNGLPANPSGVGLIEARLCFMLQWYFPHLTPLGVKRTFEQMTEIQRRVAAEKGLVFVDLNEAVPPTSDYYWDFCHTTPAGTTKVAEALASAITPLIEAGRTPVPSQQPASPAH
jgi:lysophospholipase L1-like esterase